jgi:hypothetical protein
MNDAPRGFDGLSWHPCLRRRAPSYLNYRFDSLTYSQIVDKIVWNATITLFRHRTNQENLDGGVGRGHRGHGLLPHGLDGPNPK